MKFILCLLFTFLSLIGHAKIITKTVEYRDGEDVLEGKIIFESNLKGQKPGIIIVHNWMGLTDETISQAQKVAKLGYVAFAIDIYGKGIRPKNADEAGKLAGKYKSNNRSELKARAHSALEFFKTQKNVDASKLAAIGFCFGGTTALEMGRNGEDLKGIISFHGGLSTPDLELAKNIKGKVLALHGALDPFVNEAEVAAFLKEMNTAKVDYEFVYYSGAVHSFTDKSAGNDISKGAAYNESAATRSLVAMKNFFKEIF